MAHGLGDTFRRRSINLLYYYAPLENIRSIMQRGILSRNQINALRIPHRDFSLSSAQNRRSLVVVGGRPLHDYVPLLMNPLAPIFVEHLGELGNELACVVASTRVCESEGVYFSDGNLAYVEYGTRVFSTPAEVRVLPLIDIMSTSGNNRLRGAEVLIPEKIDLQHLLYVFVTDPGNPSIKPRLPSPPEGITYHRFGSASVFQKKGDIIQELNALERELRERHSGS